MGILILSIVIPKVIWITVAIILAFITFMIIGYNWKKVVEEELMPIIIFIVLIGCLAWPLTIAILAMLGFIILPIYIGKRLGKMVGKEKMKTKEKKEFVDNLEKMIKSRS